MSFSALTSSGWSSFWQMQGGKNFGQNPNTPYASLFSRSGQERRVSQAMGMAGMRYMRAALRGLNGVNTGGTFSDSYVRVSAPASGAVGAHSGELGGLRTMETVTNASAVATTAAMATFVNRYMIDGGFIPNPNAYDPTISNSNSGRSVPYAVDLSGNGGGGKSFGAGGSF